jgi:hypothetical protein
MVHLVKQGVDKFVAKGLLNGSFGLIAADVYAMQSRVVHADRALGVRPFG